MHNNTNHNTDNNKKSCNKIMVCSKKINKQDFTAIDYICAGFGLSIGNRLADWFFGSRNQSEKRCMIDKKVFASCMKNDMSECIIFMELLKNCKCKI